MHETWIDEKDAAKLTGLSRYWFQAKRYKGGGPPYQKFGRSVRYWLPRLVEWFNQNGLRRNTSQSTPDPPPPVTFQSLDDPPPVRKLVITFADGTRRHKLIV